MEWLMANWGTILVASMLAAVVLRILVSLRKNKKQGKSSCGGNCAHCAMGSCCKTEQ